MALAFLSGAGAILSREDGRELWFSVPFGAGVGLTCDEIAVMTEHGKTYWKSEKLAIGQAAAAAVGASAIAVHRRRHDRRRS